MSNVTKLDDGRISKFQRSIYDWLVELYPTIPIEMEKLIPKSNQRIDIYIDHLGLAIECDGTFHDKPSGFYVKSIAQWQDLVQRDRAKEHDLYHHGIKLVRIPYNHKMKSAQDLNTLIESVEYPNIELNKSIFEYENDYVEKEKTKAKNYHRKAYKEYISKNKLELKTRRKEEYRRAKKAKKEYQNSLIENKKDY